SASKPPDLMIRGGDAIEIKKLQTKDSQIQLNSSFPKNKLHIEDSRIATEAKSAESWTEKDILYVVGNVDAKAKTVKSMWWVYGDCLIDEELDSVAECIFSNNALSKEFKKNGEVRVENLGVAGCLSLRFKAEWSLDCFANSLRGNGTPFLNVLMREEKYNSFPAQDRAEIEKLKEEGKIQIRSIAFPCSSGCMIACKQIFSAEVVSND
ncbi:MAG: NgoPII family restriction endonuclease, partial [Opitutales bacterium]|nr:NgoPII family restriction endonuclease [Opitutales bacterium]